MTNLEKYKKVVELTREKRSIEIWAKRRGGEFHYTMDEKSKIRALNDKIDRLLITIPKEIIPKSQDLFGK